MMQNNTKIIKLFSKKGGFTFIEIILVVVIIAVLLIILMPKYNRFKYQHACFNAAQILAADLNYIKQQSITLEAPYGIQFSSNEEYFIFRENPSNIIKQVNIKKFFGAPLQISLLPPANQIIFYPRTTSAQGATDWSPNYWEWGGSSRDGSIIISVNIPDIQSTIKVTREKGVYIEK